jgi:predicted RNase H-like HicB family nuclease
MKVSYSMLVFREGQSYVSYAPQLDVSSCGGTPKEAERMLREAVSLFLEEAQRMGTLEEVLAEAGYTLGPDGEFHPPSVVARRDETVEVAP